MQTRRDIAVQLINQSLAEKVSLPDIQDIPTKDGTGTWRVIVIPPQKVKTLSEGIRKQASRTDSETVRFGPMGAACPYCGK
jgi:hypothetical protein